MGLKNVAALKSFCGELSSDEPSPGGGTAAAAAGAMAASLLIMVCGVTAKSKKHSANKKRLEALGRALEVKRDELIALAREDARAYDLVVAAMKKARTSGDKGCADDVRKALMYAAEVPLNTADLCIDVLESAVKVSELGTRSASSDVGVATLLAHSGYVGAAMNVRINLDGMVSSPFVRSAARKLERSDRLTDKLRKDVLSALKKRAR